MEQGMDRTTTYEAWIKNEGIPIVESFGVEDFHSVERRPWARTGGKGAFIQLKGMEGFTGMYLGEIPPGGTLEPLKHLYDEIIYVLQGHGATEVWNGTEDKKATFEWGEGGLFAVPLNATYRLFNGSNEPVLYLGVTSAPPLMDLLHDPEFLFDCDHVFRNRFDGEHDFFVPTATRGERIPGFYRWETNFIADLKSASVDPAERKGAGVRITALEMSDSTLVGHIAEWPVGRYHKAHHHQGGAILLILRSHGYTLMWPKEAGVRPYESGNGDQCVKVDWQEGSVISPPTGWFHQHCNTGRVKARQFAFRYTTQSGRYKFGIGKALNRAGVRTSIRDGGTLVEYEDEDPRIRKDYEAHLRANGVTPQMPAFEYNTDTPTAA